MSLIAQLTEFLDSETRALAKDPAFDIGQSNTHKMRLLLELHRSLRHGVPEEAEISALKTALAENERELAAQLSAAREISDIVLNTLRRESDDGTYGGPAGSGF